MTDPVTATIIAELQARLTEASRRKAHLELINRMLTRLSSVTGLGNMIEHILATLMETIGASNITVCYLTGDTWNCRDVYFNSTSTIEFSDQRVLRAIRELQPLRLREIDEITGETECWVFPLIRHSRAFGAVIMEGMQLVDEGIHRELTPFFTYAALMLDNEISNYNQLLEAHRHVQESEERFRLLFDESPFGVVLVEPDTLQILHFNRSALIGLGYDAKEFSRLRVMDFEVIDNEEVIRKRSESVQQNGGATFESVHRTKQGELRNVMVYLKMINIGGTPLIQAIFRDITERKLSRQLLELYRHALDNAHDEVFLVDRTGRFCFVNRAACEILGYTQDELLTMTVSDIDSNFPPVAWEDHWRDLSIRRDLTIETTHRSKDSRLIPVEIALKHFIFEKVEYNLAVARDLTERKLMESEKLEMERKLLHSQKLESLGVLAGGIAHDFNNLLAAIMGNLDLCLLRLPGDSPLHKNLSQALQASKSAADLTRQMLTYSGRGVFENREINLGELVQRNAELLRTSIPRTVSIRSETSRDLPLFLGDPGQLQQIVMNLITNAAEAIGQNPGQISITTGSGYYDAEMLAESRLDEKPEPGRFVWLEVSDNGSGMDNETLHRLFEPFFTTKFTGRGLGMSAVLGIVRAHGGAIMLNSAVGTGSCFRILFPALAAASHAVTEKVTTPPQQVVDGNGTVLIVDDEEMIRDFCCDCLEEFGFQTLSAANGLEAIELFRSHADQVRFVILDLTMPIMDGATTFGELKSICPDLKVIISSGFGEQNVSNRFPEMKPNAFIQKPFTVHALQEVLSIVTK